MPKSSEGTHPRRPSVFWWALINVLAITFAVLAWTGCYFLFSFPERSFNYRILAKLDRLPEIGFLESSELPKGSALTPNKLYGFVYERNTSAPGALPRPIAPPLLATLNQELKRNYITAFEEPSNIHYAGGSYRIIEVRKLDSEDFISSGYALLVQALVVPAAQQNTTNPQLLPFPVRLEIILPTALGTEIPAEVAITEDNKFELSKANHAMVVLHIAQSGTVDEPITKLTVVPLLENDFTLQGDISLDLVAPTRVQPEGIFPLFSTASSDD